MAQVLFLVIDNAEMYPEILEAWENVGVPGVTMIETLGSHHKHEENRDDLPLFVSLRTVLESHEMNTRTFISVIDDDAVVDKAVDAVLKIIPDFGEGHHGVMFTVPANRMWGLSAAQALPGPTGQKRGD